jgi:CDP-diglyceride synthetase
MLKQRVIMGLILGTIFVLLLWLDSYASGGWPGAPWSTPPGFMLAMVSLFVIPLAAWEMKNLLAKENVEISMRIIVVASTLCMLWPWFEQVAESVQLKHDDAVAAHSVTPDNVLISAQIEASPWYKVGRWFRSVKPHYLVPTILVLSLLAAVIKHSRHHKVDGAMANAGGTLLAIVYLGVLPGFFLPISMTHSAWMVLAIVAVVKAADVGAYFTGKSIGRHKLIPWLSPGKTWEGFVGGLVLSGVVGAAIAMTYRGPGEPLAHLSQAAVYIGGFLSGAFLGAAGQVGDLLESLLKRDAGVKDSGKVPGFGGVLDILDSPLLAAPVAYWLLKLVFKAPMIP